MNRVRLILILALPLTVLALLSADVPLANAAGKTYYSQGNLAPDATSSWNTDRAEAD